MNRDSPTMARPTISGSKMTAEKAQGSTCEALGEGTRERKQQVEGDDQVAMI